jgi:pimeloyl-ACP methyl ester carboxylesterase
MTTSNTSARLGDPPPGFASDYVTTNTTRLHFVRGGQGPVVILLHGFPQDWVEYRAIMPELSKHMTVLAVDLPGLGQSGPAAGGYDAMHMATDVLGLVDALNLDQPYLVGHDLGGMVTYAYLRQFPDKLRGAMILDAPMAGLSGSQEASGGFWHVGFMQAPKQLAEKLVFGQKSAFLDWFYDFGKFTPEERAYFTETNGERQLHAGFEIYRALPKVAEWTAEQTQPNSVPVIVGVGEQSPFASYLDQFVEGYRAKGMRRVEPARVPDAGHYMVADNPTGVAALILQHARP